MILLIRRSAISNSMKICLDSYFEYFEKIYQAVESKKNTENNCYFKLIKERIKGYLAGYNFKSANDIDIFLYMYT